MAERSVFVVTMDDKTRSTMGIPADRVAYQGGALLFFSGHGNSSNLVTAVAEGTWLTCERKAANG